MLPLWARVDLGAMAIKGYSAFPKASELLEPHHQIYLVSYPGHSLEGLTPLQRSSQCILQPQPTGFTSIEITTVLNDYFELDIKTAEAAHRLREKQGKEKIFKCTIITWFKRLTWWFIPWNKTDGWPSDYDLLTYKVVKIIWSTYIVIAAVKIVEFFFLYLS